MQNAQGTLDLSEWFRVWLVDKCDKAGFDRIVVLIDSPTAIRRVGHIIEFFALGMTAAIASRKIWTAWVVCIAVSFLDQFLKKYVPGRHFDAVDLCFDAVGYVTAICLVWFIKSVFFPKNDKKH